MLAGFAFGSSSPCVRVGGAVRVGGSGFVVCTPASGAGFVSGIASGAGVADVDEESAGGGVDAAESAGDALVSRGGSGCCRCPPGTGVPVDASARVACVELRPIM